MSYYFYTEEDTLRRKVKIDVSAAKAAMDKAILEYRETVSRAILSNIIEHPKSLIGKKICDESGNVLRRNFGDELIILDANVDKVPQKDIVILELFLPRDEVLSLRLDRSLTKFYENGYMYSSRTSVGETHVWIENFKF